MNTAKRNTFLELVTRNTSRITLAIGACLVFAVAWFAALAFVSMVTGCGASEAGGRTSGDSFSAAMYVMGNPNGKVTAPKGTIGADKSTTTLYQNTDGAKTWVVLSATSGVGDIDSVTAGVGLTGGGTSGDVTLDVGCGAGMVCGANAVSLLDDCLPGDTLIFAPDGENPSTWLCAHEVTNTYRLDRYVTATTNGGLAVTMDDTDTTARKAFVNLRADCANGEVLKSGSSGATWSCSADSGSTGAYLGRQIITATGTYTPTSGTTRVLVRMVGGGGGSGGVAGGAGSSLSQSGGSGLYWEKMFSPGAAVTGGTVTIGAGGTGGAAGNNNGGAGGDTSIVIQGTTYTTKGGLAGNGGANTATPFMSLAASGGLVSGATSGWDVVNQNRGNPGIALGAYSWAASGGHNPLCVKAAGTVTTGAGQGAPGVAGGGSVASGYGGGASGAETTDGGGQQAGAAGGAGVVIIDEWN